MNYLASKAGRWSILFSLLYFSFFSVKAQVRLPRLVSDGMVLQRDADLTIWGWAAAHEPVEIEFLNSRYKTAADEKGNWNLSLKKLKAGGPYKMEIRAANHITLQDIMIGEVWVCSGQSNMEIPMKRVSWVYPEEIAAAEYPFIRQFYVPRKFNFKEPQKDLSSGSWVAATPETVLDFSAVGYFFAREIHKKYNVPVGIINSALGGSAAESWISEEAIRQFPQYYTALDKLKDSVFVKKVEDSNTQSRKEWMELMRQKDEGHRDPANPWYRETLNTADWDQMVVPGFWSDTKLGNVNGAVWFRKNVAVAPSQAGKSGKLILGCIVDSDSVFINEKFIGSTGYQYPPRRYDIPPGLLKAGENTIVVKVISNVGNGGFVRDKPYQIEVEETIIDLKGEWKYRLGAGMQPLRFASEITYKPVGLYNAMIAPLIHYAVKGAVWYQGETNAGRPSDYAQLMTALIKDWRKKWAKEIPFVYVQLPNFGATREQPSPSSWALLREAQSSLLSTPATAMAVTIDVGEWNDIHPLRKKEVGIRLALAAAKIAYHEEKLVHSGPLYKSMKIKGNKIILSFSNTGGGLVAKGGTPAHFSIADENRNFVWAQAKISGDQIIVWCDQLEKPVAVRYAWSDNPEDANLYNTEGLPASPFRTDGWR
jgi:sialate O-acetylesterase